MTLKEELTLRVQKMLEKQKIICQQEKNCLDKSQNSTTNSENIEYKCPKCKDKEFIMLSDGSCIECDCRGKRIAYNKALKKLEQSGISDAFRKKTFNNFKYEHHMELMNAFLKAKTYVKEFDITKENDSIAFCGVVGSGKTHLAVSIANELLDTAVGVMYMPYRHSITNLKQFITDSDKYQKEIDNYKNAEVLFIDDLFKGKITESDINIMFEIIDYRYFKGLPVIITTEKSMSELISIDEAVGSRLFEMCKDYTVHITDPKLNYRLREE